MTTRRRALLMVCAATIYAFSHRMSVVPFYDLFMQKYGITYAQAGGLLSAFFIGYALFMIPAGILADRLEARNVLVAGLIVVGTSATVFSLTDSYTVSLALRFLIGLGIALIHPSAIRILAASFNRRMLGFAIGLRESAVGVGILTAVTLFPLLATKYDPFRIFLVTGLLCIPVTAGFFWLRPSGRAPDGSLQPQRGFDMRVLLRKNVVLLAGVSFFGLFAVNGFVGWFPTYLEKGLGMEKTAAGMVMAANTAIMIAVSLVSGRISDLVGRRPVLAFGSGMLSLVLVSLIIKTSLPVSALASFAGAATALSIPPMVTLAAEIVSVENAGAVTGLVTAAGQIASAIAGSFLGWLVDLSGAFSLSWAAMLVSLAIQLGLVFYLREQPESAIPVIAEVPGAGVQAGRD